MPAGWRSRRLLANQPPVTAVLLAIGPHGQDHTEEFSKMAYKRLFTRSIVAAGLAAIIATSVAQGAGAATIPIKGGQPTPTTNFCEVGIATYWNQIDYYAELQAAGKKSDAALVLKRIQSLDQTLDDFGCWPG